MTTDNGNIQIVHYQYINSLLITNDLNWSYSHYDIHYISYDFMVYEWYIWVCLKIGYIPNEIAI